VNRRHRKYGEICLKNNIAPSAPLGGDVIAAASYIHQAGYLDRRVGGQESLLNKETGGDIEVLEKSRARAREAKIVLKRHDTYRLGKG
jgi:hypothetical protein